MARAQETINAISAIFCESTKKILSVTCGNYGSQRAVDIMNNTDVANFPTELKDIIDKIETS